MKNFQVVAPGILRGGEPDAKDLSVLKDVWHVRKIISLDAGVASDIAEFCRVNGIEHITIPIDSAATSMNDSLRRLQREIYGLLTTGGPVYLHCQQGQDRTGLAIALYRRRLGWPCDAALREARSLGFGQGVGQATEKLFVNMICADEAKKAPMDTAETDDIARRKTRKRTLRKLLLEDTNDAMAHVGVYESCNPVFRGLGPPEPCGGFVPQPFTYTIY